MTLLAQQQGFMHRVQTGDPAQPVWDGVRGHMEIYINAYQARMRQALADNFPVLHSALGDEGFDALASAYCAAHPSTHRSIRWLGDGLVDFMVAHPETVPHPALRDIARMDWAMRGAFDAADARCLQLQDLATVEPSDWPTLSLRAVPSLRVLHLEWRVEALWHTLHTDENAQTSEPAPMSHSMRVWRQQLECRWRSVDATEHIALQWLQPGVRFDDLCEGLHQAGVTDPAHKAAELLQTWVNDGLLART
jgi:hypothetical protein